MSDVLLHSLGMTCSPSGSARSAISVAMATFNGVQYLGQQLGSLFRQARLPTTWAALRRAKRAFSALFNRDHSRMSRGVLSVLRDYRGIW
ncbi:hypothetical protein DFO46_3953 [Rhizobium sp. AG855]|nr:hypothetical protein DFO46_3953 [Rhizobium sp. AG855]